MAIGGWVRHSSYSGVPCDPMTQRHVAREERKWKGTWCVQQPVAAPPIHPNYPFIPIPSSSISILTLQIAECWLLFLLPYSLFGLSFPPIEKSSSFRLRAENGVAGGGGRRVPQGNRQGSPWSPRTNRQQELRSSHASLGVSPLSLSLSFFLIETIVVYA